MQGLFKKWTEHFTQPYFLKLQVRGGLREEPMSTVWVDFFRHCLFMVLKRSHQYRYNLGTDFILNPLEGNH